MSTSFILSMVRNKHSVRLDLSFVHKTWHRTRFYIMLLQVASFHDWILHMKLGENSIVNRVMPSCCVLDYLHPHMHIVPRYII